MNSWIYIIGFLIMIIGVLTLCCQAILAARAIRQDVRLIRLYLQVGSDVSGASLPQGIWEQIQAVGWKVRNHIDALNGGSPNA